MNGAWAWLIFGVYPIMGIGPARADSKQLPTLREQAHFRAPVLVSGRPSPLGEIIKNVTGVVSRIANTSPDVRVPRVVLDPGIHDERAVITGGAAPAWEIMEGLARLSHTKWRQIGQDWVLSPIPDLAGLAVKDNQERVAALTSRIQPLKSLTAAQVRLLQSRRVFRSSDLTPQQRDAMRSVARHAYVYYGPSGIGREALELHNVSLRVSPSASTLPNTPQVFVDIVMPAADGGDETPILSVGVEQLRAIPLLPANSELPAPKGEPPPSFTGWTLPKTASDYVDDVALAPKIGKARLVVQSALSALGRLTAANRTPRRFICNTRFQFRALHAANAESTGTEVMRVVERRTGGQWRRIGDTYVLETDPLLDRLGRLEGTARSEWLLAACKEMHRKLGIRSREILHGRGILTSEDLNKEQQRQLAWIAGVAFATRNSVAFDALELKKAFLRQRSADAASGSRRRVQYIVPTYWGGEEVLAELPI